MDERVTVEFIFQFMLVFARIGVAFSRFPAIGSPYIFMRGKLASTEILAMAIWDQIVPHLPTNVKLHCVKLYETPRICVEYFGTSL